MIRLRCMPVGRPLLLLATILLPFQIYSETPRTTIALAIVSPTSEPQASVQTASVEIGGTVSSSAGLPVTVAWTINGKYGGNTEATASWSTGYINLAPGANLIEVTATDGVSTPATRQVALSLEAPPTPDPNAQSLHFQVGRYQGRLVQYRVVNGRAIFEGDIVLGDPATLDPQLTAASTQGVKNRAVVPESLGVALQSNLWPKVGGVAQVPYIITTDTTTGVTAAINAFNATFSGVIQFVARGSQTNYVNFDFDTTSPYGVCESSVGMVGNEQTVGGSIYCTTATVLHEMGHVVGLWHEQSRADRNSYVVVNTANMDRPYQPDFDPVTFNAVDIGFYDYSSIMHYGAFGFSVNGFSTLESTPVAGIPLSNSNGYSSGDIDGVKRIYGAAPRQVTIDTNPSGLQVKVDGSTVTTPYTSTGWAIGDHHTLDLPATVVQDGSGNWYTFGRWNNLSTTNTSQTITLVAGNGTSAQPAISPANTYYIANFVPLWPFSAVANSRDGVGTGTVATSPNPTTYSPAPGTYYLNRQQVQITATPGTGSQFYAWGDSNYPLGDNPHTFVATFAENPLYGNFVSTGVGLTTFGTNIAGLYYPPASITIDSNALWVPLTFAAGIDTGWTAGSSHSAVAITPFSPVTTNVQYNFLKWADQSSSSPTHPTITQVSSGRQTFTANYDGGSFRTIVYSSPACGGSVNGSATVGGALDEMFAGGSSQTFTAAANSPLVFAGWTGDLSSFGTTAAATITIGAEVFATANFNVINTPLTIGGFSPASAQAGTSGVTLTINGTGFAAGTQVFWNSSFHSSTYISPTQLQVILSAADIATAGGQTVTVQNAASVSGGTCYVFQDATYNLTAAQVAVPNVVGSTQSAASAAITTAGLVVGTVTQASSNTVPSGSVISESPVAGTLVNPGSSVNLVVSSGPAQGPTADSVTPSSGSGTSQTFAFKYSSANGYGNLSTVYGLFNTAVSSGNGCDIQYRPATNQLYLFNDAGSALLGPVTPGLAGTLSNSQCTLNAGGSSVSGLSNTLTVNAAVSFTAAFIGTKTVYGYALDKQNLNSGWKTLGSWTTAAIQPIAPTADSVAPSTGVGASQTFAVKYSSVNGYGYLSTLYALLNTSVSSGNGCDIQYRPAMNQLYLFNDAGSALLGPVTPGVAGTLSNSRCTLNAGTSSVSGSSNTLTVNVALSFAPAFGGLRTVYGYAVDKQNLNSGWKTLGNWTTSALQNIAPTADSVTPSSGAGTSQTFAFKYSSVNGYPYLSTLYALFNTALSSGNGCDIQYRVASNQLYLFNDTGSALLGPVTPGVAGTLSNSQCTLNAGTSSVSGSLNTLTVNAAVSFSPAFIGTKTVYGYAVDKQNLNSGWKTLGSWTTVTIQAITPTADSVTPSSGTGAGRTFAFKYSSVNGYGYLSTVYAWFDTVLSSGNGCDVQYRLASNQMYLFNDAGSALLGPVTPGVAGTLSNSQCTLNAGTSSVSGSGNTLTVNAAVSFTAKFAGAKAVYGYALDKQNLNSGWKTLGSWTVTAP